MIPYGEVGGPDLKTARRRALTVPCDHRAPQTFRRKPGDLAADNLACGALVNEPCINPRTGQPLEHVPAHLVRMRRVGIASEPRPSAAVA